MRAFGRMERAMERMKDHYHFGIVAYLVMAIVAIGIMIWIWGDALEEHYDRIAAIETAVAEKETDAQSN